MKCQCDYLQMLYKDKEETIPSRLMCTYLSEFKKALYCDFKDNDKQAKIFCRCYKNSHRI